jgi:hypothetical protein
MKSSPVHINISNDNILQIQIIWTNTCTTRGPVGWARVAHLSFCFEETLFRTFLGASYQISIKLAKWF